LRTGNHAIRFNLGSRLGFFNQLCGTLVCLGNNFGRFLLGFMQVFNCAPAARPSAICFLRSANAFMMGGHTNCMQNHTNTKNVMDWPIRVALIFMPEPFYG
jgi:hypothetical protein